MLATIELLLPNFIEEISLKHLHMTLALLSILFFSLRFFWLLKGSEQLQKKWVKVLPHIIDTFLLLLGIGLMMALSLYPAEQPWLAEKIIGLVAYILTGYYTLKLARNKIMQVIGYLGALGWFLMIVKLAVTKQALFLSL